MSDSSVRDPEVQLLAAIATALKPDCEDTDSQWLESPFGWLKQRPSRQRGAILEKIVAGYFVANEFDVVKSPDSQADRIIENIRVEVKSSTLWKSGIYKFQQLRDQNYDVAICLGLSPFDAHCWILPKETIMRNWGNAEGLSSQHGGVGGSDTAWLSISPTRVQDWLVPYGGALSQSIEVFRTFVMKSAGQEPAAPARR